MKKRVFFTGPVVKIVAAFAIVVAFGIVVYSMSGFPSPRESDRIWARDGTFSIIKPRNWESQAVQSPEDAGIASSISITSSKALGLGERMFVERLRLSPDLEKLKANGFKPRQFQGHEAWVLGSRTRIEYTIEMLFLGEDKCWYRIRLWIGAPEELQDSKWWPFVNSFDSRPKSVESANPPTTNPTSSQ